MVKLKDKKTSRRITFTRILEFLVLLILVFSIVKLIVLMVASYAITIITAGLLIQHTTGSSEILDIAQRAIYNFAITIILACASFLLYKYIIKRRQDEESS